VFLTSELLVGRRSVTSIMLHQLHLLCTLNRGLGRCQGLFGFCGEDKNLNPSLWIEARYLGSRSVSFTSNTVWTGDWVDTRDCLDSVEKVNIVTPPWESNPYIFVKAPSALPPLHFEQGIGSIPEIVWIPWRRKIS